MKAGCASAIVVILLCGSFVASGAETRPATQEVRLAARYTLDMAALWAQTPADGEDWGGQRQELERIVQRAQKPLDQAAAHLALANWLLAVPTAKPATKWVLNMASEEDLEVLIKAAAEADEHLKQARLLLKPEPDTAPSPPSKRTKAAPDERRSRLEMTTEQLASFMTVLSLAKYKGDDRLVNMARSHAARSLSAVREAADENLAACALMWQAFAWNLAGREGRSTVALPSATVKPDEPSYDFINRLLRCQILADSSQFPVAFAMALRICGSCPDWFPKDSKEQVQARERLAAMVQCRVGEQWLARLRAENFPANADRLETQMVHVQNRLFKDLKPPVAIYVLDRAIPILIEPPTIETGPVATTQTGPATATATSPD